MQACERCVQKFSHPCRPAAPTTYLEPTTRRRMPLQPCANVKATAQRATSFYGEDHARKVEAVEAVVRRYQKQHRALYHEFPKQSAAMEWAAQQDTRCVVVIPSCTSILWYAGCGLGNATTGPGTLLLPRFTCFGSTTFTTQLLRHATITKSSTKITLASYTLTSNSMPHATPTPTARRSSMHYCTPWT